jgi:hypothetical protein
MGDNRLIVPAETSVLCESCGYTLDGLPTTGQCPECGAPIAQSTTSDGRKSPPWESITHDHGTLWRFFSTTWAVLLRPCKFYRTLATRTSDQAAFKFARIHWTLSAFFLAGALAIHAFWYERFLLGPQIPGGPWLIWAAALPLTYLFLWRTTSLAARLSAWEAAYWGMRLPLPVVLRAMYYHAAHYQPVALMAFITVAGNYALIKTKWISEASAQRYLIILCIEVLLGAGYLFKTYWVGMKGVRYANR